MTNSTASSGTIAHASAHVRKRREASESVGVWRGMAVNTVDQMFADLGLIGTMGSSLEPHDVN